MTGTVLHSVGGVYTVALDGAGIVEAALRGRLKLEARRGARVVAGDRVELAESDGEAATIEAVLERRTELVRYGPRGRKPRVVAANVDRVLVVVAAHEPDPRHELVDRFLVLGEASGLECMLVVNKMDLPGAGPVAAELADLYGGVGYTVVCTSAVTGAGIDELTRVLCSGSSTLVGPSGVGKSSLLNRIQPGLQLRTGELSRRVRRGRHTTVSARLIRLGCGGWVLDTPGFAQARMGALGTDGLVRCFPEIAARSDGCYFRGCSHTHEPDCAVLAAVERSDIDPRRYESYAGLLQEVR